MVCLLWGKYLLWVHSGWEVDLFPPTFLPGPVVLGAWKDAKDGTSSKRSFSVPGCVNKLHLSPIFGPQKRTQ